MTALMEYAGQRRQLAVAIGAEHGGEVVGVDEILRRRVQVEDGEDAGLDPRLPPRAADLAPVERQGLAEAHGGHVLQLPLIEVALIGSGEMWPARIGHQRVEELTTGE